MSIVGPLRLKAQIMCGEEPAMGPGKALVLEAIDRAGSISAAGRDLAMSYRRIWLLVDSMNRCWAEPLVETAIGGGRNRGARLTVQGRAVLAAFRALEARLERAAFEGDYARLLEGLRTEPLDPAPATPAAKR